MADNHPKPLPLLSEKDIKRFWSKVDVCGPDDCWPWKTSCFQDGYGQFGVGGRNLKSHRIAHFLKSGIDPFPLLTCHSCDQPNAPHDISYRKCCNGAHLFTGTPADNAADMVAKGRSARGARHASALHPGQMPKGESHWAARNPERYQRGEHSWVTRNPDRMPRGEANGSAKLTSDIVSKIRTLHASGHFPYCAIATEFGIAKSTVCSIVRRKTWKHIS